MAFHLPTHFQFPLQLIDEDLKNLTGDEFKVLAAIVRLKYPPIIKDEISLDIPALSSLTGLSEWQCAALLGFLAQKGIISEQIVAEICSKHPTITKSEGSKCPV